MVQQDVMAQYDILTEDDQAMVLAIVQDIADTLEDLATTGDITNGL